MQSKSNIAKLRDRMQKRMHEQNVIYKDILEDLECEKEQNKELSEHASLMYEEQFKTLE